jgi:hypothetical protein
MNILCPLGTLCGHLLYSVAICYILWTFVKLHTTILVNCVYQVQEKSGNPGTHHIFWNSPFGQASVGRGEDEVVHTSGKQIQVGR